MMRLCLAAALLAGCTCREEPTITATVVDWWMMPVEGATVSVVDSDIGPFTTGPDGRLELPMKDIWQVRVEGPGVVTRTTDVVPLQTSEPHDEKIEVVPIPPGPGFHVIGPDRYLPVEGQPVVRVTDGIAAWHGIRGTGDVEVEGDPLKIVYHSPLKAEQVAQLDLELHQLSFVEDRKVTTVEGEAAVDVDLWVSAGKVQFVKKQLEDGNTWAIRVDGLDQGTYAFVTNNLLEAGSEDAFEATPKEVRKVYAFTID